MSTLQIAEAYRDACAIVMDARIDSAGIQPVWDKLFRILEYLKRQRDNAYQAAYGEVLA